jgi:hypothetical protein
MPPYLDVGESGASRQYLQCCYRDSGVMLIDAKDLGSAARADGDNEILRLPIQDDTFIVTKSSIFLNGQCRL